MAQVVDEFVRTYERLYGAGTSIGRANLELVTLRAEGLARIPRIFNFRRRELGPPSPAKALLGRRKLWWRQLGGFHDTDAFQLERLAPGNVIEGPAIIESYGTSIPVHPGQQAHVDEWLNLVLSFSKGSMPIKSHSLGSRAAERMEAGA
jgi:N-methylhydantoinase A